MLLSYVTKFNNFVLQSHCMPQFAFLKFFTFVDNKKFDRIVHLIKKFTLTSNTVVVVKLMSCLCHVYVVLLGCICVYGIV